MDNDHEHNTESHTHTHTHIYIHTYIYIYYHIYRTKRDITWTTIMNKVFSRPSSLTYAPSADIHTVISGRVAATFPMHDISRELEGIHGTEKRLSLAEQALMPLVPLAGSKAAGASK